MKQRAVLLMVLLLAMSAFVAAVRSARIPVGDQIHLFEGLTGPEKPSRVAAEVPTSWRGFEDGGTSRLAILLSDEDSAWLGLVHGLRSIGLPFLVTDDYERALQHRVVLVYPRISGRTLAPGALQSLAGFVHTGGTLVGVNVLGGGLEALFGFAEVAPRRDHTRVRFDLAQAVNAGFDDPREAEIRIAAERNAATGMGTHDYLAPVQAPLAVYEDGAAAIVERVFDSGGRACAFGFDLGLLLLKAHNRRLEGVSDDYANAYDPSADVPLRLLAALYRRGEPLAASLEPVPDAQRIALLVTHDVDYSRSIANSVRYAAYEREAGFAATYFIQAKYVRDWNDEIFLDETGARHLERLAALQMEIASHSVAHSAVFDTFALGSGDETYPDYRPFVKSRNRTYGGTILGELRVSRFLLAELGGMPVVSFRPGHLSNPRLLPQALAASDYRYSSSVTANVSLGHLPFRLNHSRDSRMESDVFEFPITVEDELGAPMLERLGDAVDLAKRIARHGGIYVLLIHPDTVEDKLSFERQLVEAVREFAWVGALQEFGAWWAARDAVTLDLRATPAGAVAEIVAPTPLEGLTLRLPPGLAPEADAATAVGDGRWVLGRVEGRVALPLRRTRD